MTDSPATLRDVFELPEPNAPEASSEEWKDFQQKIIKEVKGIKLASMPDIAKKFGELFDIPIPDIFMTSWTKANAIQAVLEESRKSPETVMNIELGEHTLVSEHKPCIEVKIRNAVVKKLEFTLRLGFVLKGFNLKIKDGAIREIQTGLCEAKGTVEYDKLVIAEKKLAPIALPGSIKLSESEQEQEEQKVMTAGGSSAQAGDVPQTDS
jgi:hypothetical protein